MSADQRVGINLREAIKRSGKSITAVASEIGMSRAYLSEVLNGHHSILVTNLDRITEVIGVDIADLFIIPSINPQ